jgi:hypothetical protein
MPLEPVILFFLLGLLAGLLRSDLKIPAVLHESLSIFLLLAIGLKGGVELARQPWPSCCCRRWSSWASAPRCR